MANQRLAKKRLGDLLVDSKLITGEQLKEALAAQKITGERLGQALISLGLITEKDILNALETQLCIPRINLAENINPALIKKLPQDLIRHHMAIPVSLEGNRMIVAMFDPLNLLAFDDIRTATGYIVEPVIASQQEIEQAINKVFGLSFVEEAFGSVKPETNSLLADQTLHFSDEPAAEDSPVIRLVNTIIRQAVHDKASDIHLEPLKDQIRVRYRVDGILHETTSLPRSSHSSLVARIKIMSNLDIAEKRLPQDGRFQIRYAGNEIDLRVSTLPTVYGEKVVMRLLSKSANILKIDQLGLNENSMQPFNNMIRHSYGLILATGPTGSGKTTTLFAVLNAINSLDKNIVTIEDPVEYLVPGINQVQVNNKAGLAFATGLRSILRQDPDIIMVGEIRDAETAMIAVKAATTGHLVLSTLHTNDAAGAITRLIDMGVEPFLVASSLAGIISQRLVRTLCSKCKRSYLVEPGTPEGDFLGLTAGRTFTAYAPAGCSQCAKIGYRGRIGIQEVLPVTPAIRQMAKQRASEQEIKSQARLEGMLTMREDGIEKVRAGITSVKEIMRVVFSEEEN